MTRILKTLIVDDDPDVRNSLHKLLNNKIIIENEYLLITEPVDFTGALEILKHQHFDLITLDLCKGDPAPEADKTGIDVLTQIQALTFIPVVFYTGLPKYVEDLKSPVVKVVNKNDGVETLKKEIVNLIKSRLVDLKNNLHDFIEAELKQYFWDTIHKNRKEFNAVENETSLSYLITRRISQALSKEKIKDLLQDDKIKMDKVHPMEFYIYPVIADEYETGEILKKDDKYFVILTPSCDFVEDKIIKRDRKVGRVLLAETLNFEDCDEYKAYIGNKNAENKKKLAKVIGSGKSDRNYFLPGTPFMKAKIIDFQLKQMVDYSDLATNYERIMLIDSPFTQSMIASFIRFYNRIGSPDLDSEFIIAALRG
jgi:CheY-like chemotaxis protein